MKNLTLFFGLFVLLIVTACGGGATQTTANIDMSALEQEVFENQNTELIDSLMKAYLSKAGSDDLVAPEKSKFDALLKSTEDLAYNDTTKKFGVNAAIFPRVAKMYETYAQLYPDAEDAAEQLYKAAGIYESALGDFEKAIAVCDDVIARFPKDVNASRALLTKGFVYENNLRDLAQAKKTYESFLTKYPESDMAASVKIMIENLGLSPEQLLERAKQSNK